MDSFSYPFRFAGGKVVKVDDQTDQYAAQIVAAAIKTAPGELPITSDFGSKAAEFSSLDTTGLLYSVSTYHPTITIDSIVEDVAEDVNSITIGFTRQET